jgi:DNA polymerase III epsilon subunit family exonuclease
VPVVVIDLEMTGLDLEEDRICEVGLVRRNLDGSIETFESLVRPQAVMSEAAFAVHGISPEELAGAPAFAEVSEEVLRMLDGAVLVGHHVPVDWHFLIRELRECGHSPAEAVMLDTLQMSRRLFAFPQNDLTSVCSRLEVPRGEAHRALSDAYATFEVFNKMVALTDPDDSLTIDEWGELITMLAPRSSLREFQQRVLREAFRRKITVVLNYLSSSHPLDGVIQREVDIWRLRLPRVQGWCHLREGERVFRSDRIRKVKLGSRGYVVPPFKRRV